MARYKVYRNPHNGHTEKVKDGFNWVVLFSDHCGTCLTDWLRRV